MTHSAVCRALAVCAAVASGCGPSKHGDAVDPSTRGVQRFAPDKPTPAKPAARQAPRARFDEEAEAPTDPSSAAEPEKAEEKKRDLPAELQSALGGSTSCLEVRPAGEAPERIVISINAQVMGSGRVSRASVSSSALHPAELDCIRKLAESTRLAGPIDGAPLPVATSIELAQQKRAPP